MSEYKDFIVETANPKALDQTLNQMGAALVQSFPGEYEKDGERYIMRTFGNSGFITFACENQGYCKIVGEREG